MNPNTLNNEHFTRMFKCWLFGPQTFLGKWCYAAVPTDRSIGMKIKNRFLRATTRIEKNELFLAHRLVHFLRVALFQWNSPSFFIIAAWIHLNVFIFSCKRHPNGHFAENGGNQHFTRSVYFVVPSWCYFRSVFSLPFSRSLVLSLLLYIHHSVDTTNI